MVKSEQVLRLFEKFRRRVCEAVDDAARTVVGERKNRPPRPRVDSRRSDALADYLTALADWRDIDVSIRHGDQRALSIVGPAVIAVVEIGTAADGNRKLADRPEVDVVVLRPCDGDECFAMVRAVLKLGFFDAIVIDNVDALCPKRFHRGSLADWREADRRRWLAGQLMRAARRARWTRTRLVVVDRRWSVSEQPTRRQDGTDERRACPDRGACLISGGKRESHLRLEVM